MLFSVPDITISDRYGSEWEKTVNSPIYTPGNAVQMMRAVAIKRKSMLSENDTLLPTLECPSPDGSMKSPRSEYR